MRYIRVVKDLRKFCMASTPEGETSSQATPKTQTVHASMSALLLKDQNSSVDFVEILDI